MAPIDPATIVPAAAALGGVALTIVSQAVISRGQRRSDRVTKLFDAKLELYNEMSTLMQSMGGGFQELNTAHAGAVEIIAESKVVRDRSDQAAVAVSEFQKAHLQPDGTLDPALAGKARELIRAYSESKAIAESTLKKAKAWSVKTTEYQEAAEAIRLKHARFLELAPRVQLVSDEAVSYQFAILVQMILIKKDVTRTDIVGFQRAVRRELGVQESRFWTNINRVRKWVRVRRLRSLYEPK